MSLNEDLGETIEPSSELFKTEEERPTLSPSSNSNLAAHGALLTGDENIGATFDLISTELADGGVSETSASLVQLAKDGAQQSSEDALTEMLLDPTVSQVDKQSAIQGFSELAVKPTSIQDVVSEQALIAPSEGETVEAEVIRISTAQLVTEINDFKRQKTAILNAAAAEGSSETADIVLDLVEIIAPFTESKLVTQVMGDVRGKHKLKDFVLSGSAKEELRAAIAAMPIDQQLEASQKVVDIISKNSSIILPGDNDFAKLDLLRTVLEDGYYTQADKYLDNMVSLLDMTILGGALSSPVRSLKKLVKGFRGAKPPSVGDTVADSVKSSVSPSSVSQNLKDTNPGKSKNLHDAVVNSEGDDVAKAAYGADKNEAVANDLLQEVAKTDGSVKNKVGNMGSKKDQEITGNPDTLEFNKKDGQIYYFEQEKRSARAHIANDLHNAVGITTRSELTTVDSFGGSTRFSMKYGPEQGGWSNAEDAIEGVKISLRDLGITDDNIKLLYRDGENYVPTTLADEAKLADGPQDYIVQVDYDYKVNPMDVEEWSKPDVKRNLFDRSALLSGTSNGSFQRHLLDAASMLDPKLTGGAAQVIDKSAELDRKLVEELKKFSDTYVALPADRQQMVESLLKEANFKSQGPNLNKLIADGFTPKEVEALSSWKNFGDTMYWLENADLVKTLSNQGFGVIDGTKDGSKLFAKGIQRGGVKQNAKVYDPIKDEVVTLSGKELDDLYEAGGEVATLKQPTMIDDDMVDLIVTTNKPGASYLRRLNPEDSVLTYKPWHYQVRYKAPYFIDELVHNSKGEFLYKKAVAVSGNVKDAEREVRRLTATTGRQYAPPRRDIKMMDLGSEDYWSLQVTTGRTSQRVRGKRLEDSTNPMNSGADNQWVLGPIDSAIAAARNMSKRASTRDYLDATKARFMENYGDLIPKNKYGQVAFPRTSKDISNMGSVGKGQSKRLADARTTYEYIKSVENGYVNSLDDAFKALFRGVGDIAGSMGLKKAEGSANFMADNVSITSDTKQLATTLYITTNPLRQIAVQSSQAMQLMANFPGYVGKQGLARDMSWLYTLMSANGEVGSTAKKLIKAAGRTETEAKDMYRWFMESGQASGIDRQALVKGSLTDLVEASKITGKNTILSKTLGTLRKYGFDAGETVNVSTSWLAHYDKISKAKKGRLTQADLDQISASARNYTGNFNDAGRMPYSENFLGLVFHYAQVPHKLILTGLTNRGLSPAERVRLTTFNALMFSLPPATMYSMFGDILPEGEEARDLVVQGLLGYTFNSMLTQASQMVDESQPKTKLDFSNMAPNDMTGLVELVHGLFTTDAGEIMANTPAGQLFFGANPRLTNLAKSSARLFNYFDDEQEPIAVATLAKETAKMFSGMSNLWKAKMALQTGLKRNSLGNITDTQVSAFEGVGQAFGYPTMDESQRRWIGNERYVKTKAFKDDVKEYYKTIKRNLAVDGIDPKSHEGITRVVSYASQGFEGVAKIEAQRMIGQLLKRDAKDGDGSLYNSIIRASGMMDAQETHNMIDAIPDWDEKKRQKAHDTINFMHNFKIESEVDK